MSDDIKAEMLRDQARRISYQRRDIDRMKAQIETLRPENDRLRAEVEALRNLAHHAERANEIALREVGIGVCDINAISAARAAIAKAEKETGNG